MSNFQPFEFVGRGTQFLVGYLTCLAIHPQLMLLSWLSDPRIPESGFEQEKIYLDVWACLGVGGGG